MLQATADVDNLQLSRSAAVARAASKAGNAYGNRGRDLIDTFADEPAKVNELPVDELPEAMREMTEDERVEYLDEMAERRQALQAEIQKLNEERAAFLAEELKRRADGEAADTLGDAVTGAVSRQLEARGFSKPATRPAE